MINEVSLRLEYDSKADTLINIRDAIVDTLRETLDVEQYVDSIQGRVKSKDSFIRKAIKGQERYRNPFQDIEDIIGIRILVLFKSASGNIANKITSSVFPPVETSYRMEATPKAFGYEGYQSIHSIPISFIPKDGESYPRVFELQVRTLFQHAFSEPEHELNYKRSFALAEGDDFEYQKKFAWLSATSWGADSILEELYNTYKKMDPS
jgi:ppGpp synthetase/RelA/SpoT-type nucleotidyltranferase